MPASKQAGMSCLNHWIPAQAGIQESLCRDAWMSAGFSRFAPLNALRDLCQGLPKPVLPRPYPRQLQDTAPRLYHLP